MRNAVQQIKDRLNITDVLSSYIKLEKAGINWKAKCPFHNEKTPSFFVSSARQSYYCFGCGEKGDMFTFVEKFEGLDFKGALATLANKAGIVIETSQDSETREEKDRMYQIMDEASKYFERELQTNNNAQTYLKSRGINEKTRLEWRIGFAKDDWRSLHDFLIQNGYTRNEMLELGLVKKVENEEKYYDTFRGRLMFPISDSAGRVIAFSGRSLNADSKTPKYLNSPETPLFYKSEVLYGFHIAKNSIRSLNYAVLVEGQIDLTLSHQSGVPNTVASSGTALTELHLKKISKLSNRVIIAYDGDEAGIKAALRAAAMALSMGMEVKVAKIDNGEDPASLITKDPDSWKNVLRDAVHAVDFALGKAMIKKDLAKAIWDDVLPLISNIQSEIEKSHQVKKVAAKIGVSEEAVLKDLAKVSSTNPETRTEYKDTKQEPTSTERTMVGIIFLLQASGSDKVSELISEWSNISSDQDINSIIAKYEHEKESMIFESENGGLNGKEEEAFKDLLKRIERKNLQSQLRKAALMLDSGIAGDEEIKRIHEDIEKIQNRINIIGT